MFWNNSRTSYNLSKVLGSFGFLPLRGAGTGFVVVLPLSLILDPPLYILHFTIYTTFHSEATLKTALELLDYSVNNNTRVYQIHKESGVANRFLTARRHFWTPWSERTHCMDNGQSVFFLSPHTPYGRVRLARFARVRLLRHTLPISLLIFRKKPTVLQSNVVCGLSCLLLVLPLVPRLRFFSRYPGFYLTSKPNISKFQFDQEW